jgi:hypothetical protein
VITFDALYVSYRFWFYKKNLYGKIRMLSFSGLKTEEFAILAESSRLETEYF